MSDNEAKWRYWVGLIAQGLGEGDAAIAALERGAELDPGYGVTHARLGDLLFERDQLDAADAAYERASQREPAAPLGFRGRAEIALRRGDATAAIQLVDASIRRAPGDFRSHRIRAQGLSSLGLQADSLAAIERASELPVYSGWTTFDPRLSEAIAVSGTLQSLEMRLGVALQTGDLAAAAEVGEKLFRRRPRSISVMISLASIEANRGRTKRALELSTRAVELEPSSIESLSLHCEVAISAGASAVVEQATTRLLAWMIHQIAPPARPNDPMAASDVGLRPPPASRAPVTDAHRAYGPASAPFGRLPCPRAVWTHWRRNLMNHPG